MNTLRGTDTNGTGQNPSALSFLPYVTFLLLVCGVATAASVKIQLFQDGSSYLLEIFVSGSAIRHERLSAYIVQFPTILVGRVSQHLHLSSHSAAELIEAAFVISYASVPVIALIWSWLLIKERDPGFWIWPATVILLVNLPNYSAVSELLLAIQLACPLMIALFQYQQTTGDRITATVLVPIIFFLHPLSFMIFSALALALLGACKDREMRRRALVLGAIAIGRVLYSVFTLSSYEREMLQPSQVEGYMLISTVENFIFLVGVTSAVLLVASDDRTQQQLFEKVSLWALVIISGLLFALNLRSAPEWSLWWFGLTALVGAGSATLLSPWVAALPVGCVWMGALLLVSQYFVNSGKFSLKTGLAVISFLILIIAAAYDANKKRDAKTVRTRTVWITNGAAIFLLVTIAKASIWATATEQLLTTLDDVYQSSTKAAASSVQDGCIELDDKRLDWTTRGQFRIIANWSLPSLALVESKNHNKPVIVMSGGCPEYRAGAVMRLDEWTVLRRSDIPFLSGLK